MLDEDPDTGAKKYRYVKRQRHRRISEALVSITILIGAVAATAAALSSACTPVSNQSRDGSADRREVVKGVTDTPVAREAVAETLQALASPLDHDGDGYFESLTVHVQVPITTPGEFSVMASMVMPDTNAPGGERFIAWGNPPGNSLAPFSATIPILDLDAPAPGTIPLAMAFDGEALRHLPDPAKVIVQLYVMKRPADSNFGAFTAKIVIVDTADFGRLPGRIETVKWQDSYPHRTVFVDLLIRRSGRFVIEVCAWNGDLLLACAATDTLLTPGRIPIDIVLQPDRGKLSLAGSDVRLDVQLRRDTEHIDQWTGSGN